MMDVKAELPIPTFSVVLLKLGLLVVCKPARVAYYTFIFAIVP